MNTYYACEQAYKNGYAEGEKRSGTQTAENCACVSNAKIFGLEDSIRRAKFPHSTDTGTLTSELTSGIRDLACCPAGSGHDQWLTGVIAQFDLTFSIKAWTEAERYHFFDFISSQSTMHRITRFDPSLQYDTEYVDSRIVEIMQEKIDEYRVLENNVRSCEQDGGNDHSISATRKLMEHKYLEILYSNPAGFKLTAGITTNYRQLKTIYAQRKNHRLPEWRTFCKWIETLPHSELITGRVKE